MEKNEIFTVENAKVANLNYKFYSNAVQGYLKDGDGLVYVVVVRTLVNLKEQEVTTLMRDFHDKDYTRHGDFNLYESPEAYENGKAIKHLCRDASELVRCASYKTLEECPWKVADPATNDSPQYGYIVVWVFEDGEPKMIPVVVNAVCHDDRGWHLSDGSLPEKYWESKADAFSFNEYRVIDGDGEEFIEQGVQMRISLTAEQWAIIKEMRELFNKAKGSGIKFIWDRDNCGNIEALNMQNVADYGYDVNPHEGGQLVSFGDVIFADTGISFYDYYGDEKNNAIALKPTEREKKLWLKNHPQQ